MRMTFAQRMITIAMVVLGTVLTRFIPFWFFPADKPTPKYIQYLGKTLPSAAFGLLVIYCLKNVSVFYGKSRGAGISGGGGSGGSAPLEKADAPVRGGRNGFLHVAGAVCVLIMKKAQSLGKLCAFFMSGAACGTRWAWSG